MSKETLTQLDFGNAASVDASLSGLVRGLVGSEILKIAGQIRELIATGKPVCNLTVGDFDPKQFPIPASLLDGIQRALAKGETNYPPAYQASGAKSVKSFESNSWMIHVATVNTAIDIEAAPRLSLHSEIRVRGVATPSQEDIGATIRKTLAAAMVLRDNSLI